MKLSKKLEKLWKKGGRFGSYIITGSACYASNPYAPNLWECEAIAIDADKNIAAKGKLSWYDFSDDASIFPWNDQKFFYSFEVSEEFDLSDDDRVKDFLKQL